MLRRRRPSRLWSVLAIVAMLWTQVVYAMHGGCAWTPATMPMAMTSAASAAANHGHDGDATAGHHCDAAAKKLGDAGCQVHCSQKESSAEVWRVPPVPALLPLAFPKLEATAVARGDAARIPLDYTAPEVRPRGPTRHPAPLLLI